MNPPLAKPLALLLRSLERRLFVVLFLFGLGRVLRNSSLLLLALYVLDRLLAPPLVVRMVLLVLAVALWFWYFTIDFLRPLRQRPAARDLAAIWERKAPQLEDRLATAVELHRRPEIASPAMLATVTAEAVELSQGLDPQTVVPTGRARRSCLSGSAAMVLLLIGIWAYPQEASIFIQRLLGANTAWPSDTHLVLMPAYLEGLAEPVDFEILGLEDYGLAVARNAVLSLRIRAEGVVPERIFAEVDGNPRPMHALGGGNFVLRLPPLRHDLLLRFRGGDDTDGFPRLRIQAGDAPSLAAWQVHVEPPAYTNLPAEEGPFHELRILQGATVELRLQPDLPSSQVDVTNLSGESTTLQQQDGQYRYSFSVQGSGELSVALTGEDGFRQDRAAVFRWTAIPDRRPEPRVLFPSERWTTVPGGTIPIALFAEDDFGLSSLSLSGYQGVAIALDFAAGSQEFQQVLRIQAPSNYSAESFEENRFRLQFQATDNAQPQAKQAQSQSPWVELVPAAMEEQRLAERIVRLRERLEGLRDRSAAIAEGTNHPSMRQARRLWKDLDATLGTAESFLLERIYSGLDRQTMPLWPQVESQLAKGKPSPGVLTEALLDPELPSPLDRAGMLLDLSRALWQARQGPADALLESVSNHQNPQGDAALLREQLDAILVILLSWEDFNSAINLLRALLERQRGLYLRTQEASER